MLNRRRGRELAEQTAARQRREDEAPRLIAEVPSLTSLSLTIEEHRPGGLARLPHIRRVVVERAPALFVVRCGTADCADGVHDLTYAVMHGLRRGATTLDGEVGCDACTCVLRFVGKAAYR